MTSYDSKYELYYINIKVMLKGKLNTYWLPFIPSVSGAEVRILSLPRMQSAMGERLRLVRSGYQQGEIFSFLCVMETWELW